MSKKLAANVANKTGALESVTGNGVALVKAEGVQINNKTDRSSPLNDEEQKLFAECENDIQENLRGTFVVGWRLEQIRDQRLYRGEGYKTFEVYCTKRWDLSKTHANRQIRAYLCEQHLKSVKNIEVYVPTKESEVRFIADLTPEQWVEVATKVREKVGDGKATAGDFGVARQELFPKPKREVKTNAPAKETPQAAKAIEATPKFDTNLVSFSKLKDLADKAYNLCGTKTQDALKYIGKLQRHLDEWSDWQAKQEVK